jgi:hypothetical protein
MKLKWFERRNYALGTWTALCGLTALVNLACAQTGYGQAPPALAWQAVAASADGNLLLAAANGAPIYLSTNAGAMWNPTLAPADLWQSAAISADGAVMVAAAGISFQTGDPPSVSGDGLIYRSTNSGATWLPAMAPNNAWSGVASSADGTRLVAVASVLRPFGDGAVLSGDGSIYGSTNSGASWYATSAPSDNWKSIASSSDGTRLVAAVDISVSTGGGLIYVSTNAGLTWVQTLAATGFSSVASSADGTRLVAADDGCSGPCLWPHNLYVSTNSGASWTVSWTVTGGTGPAGAPWPSLASSADGMTLAAACSFFSDHSLSSGVWLSHDGGENWALTSLLPDASWAAVACSADGRRLVAAAGDGPLATLPYVGPWRTTGAPATSWRALALSEDGSKLAAVDGNYIYTSTNFGTSWAMTSAPSGSWQSVAFSAAGSRLLAAGWSGFIYISTNSGATWTQTTAPGLGWAAVAISADGAKLAAAPYSGRLYVSSDAGASFTSSGPSNSWSSVASSADGTRLAAASPDLFGGGGLIYVSTNSGATWTPTSDPSNYWTSVASSGDGTQLVAAATDDLGQSLMYISRDSGASWSATTAPPEFGWGTVTSSADGTRLVALATVEYAETYSDFFCDGAPSCWLPLTDSRVYLSTDSGATWSRSDTPASAWAAAAISADGSNIVALSELGIAGLLQWPLPPSFAAAVEPAFRKTFEHSTAPLNVFRRAYPRALLGEFGAAGTGKLLLDKNPSLTAQLPVLLRVVPELRALVALRDPRDVVLSCYFQNILLNPTNANFLSFERLAKHDADLMDIWLAVREWEGLAWLETRYEDMVADLEKEGRRVTGFLGLVWHEEQKRFYEKGRQLYSPTYQDVRRPVYARSVGRWHAYEKHLAPILPALEPYCGKFGYTN